MTRGHALTLGLILVVACALRLYHLHDPILDHPAWRQGDEAAIARNFAQLRDDIFYPQTDYDGPPPNYVELELQIVPYAAAQLYRVFGVHEVFARLIVIAFSLATIPLVYALGRALYSPRAGLLAAMLLAIAPGAVYYGRAIIPESVMLFFSVGALLWWWRFCERRGAADFVLSSLFAALAVLAKPPAAVILAPMLAVWYVRRRSQAATALGALRDWAPLVLAIAVVLPAWLYFAHVHRIAQWHWVSGITSRHVVPALVAVATDPHRLAAAVQGALALLRMLASTILGPAFFGLVLVSALTQPPDQRARARSALFGAWIAALAAYAFVVVNVERVDYYLMPFVPFAVLYAGGGLDRIISLTAPDGLGPKAMAAAMAGLCIATYAGMLEIHPYYTWNRGVFAAAGEVRGALEPGTLVVMGHYDPSVLYTIGHRGWEEDPLLWDVHDMTSAIAKGARYYVAVEVPRLRANAALYSFLQRYRRVPVRSGWQVYDLHHFARPAGRAAG